MVNKLYEEIEKQIREYVVNNFPLSQLSDDELRSRIEELAAGYYEGKYIPIDKKVEIVENVYSSIRGFGILDTIMKDESITEVMINGKDNVFIEEKGKVHRIEQTFESERRLEDVIQRIVGLAGREVNQANPICDTRLPDGSRVNVVLPPIALCGPTVTIRKFSKTPMTI